jgi:hypothetical protein
VNSRETTLSFSKSGINAASLGLTLPSGPSWLVLSHRLEVGTTAPSGNTRSFKLARVCGVRALGRVPPRTSERDDTGADVMTEVAEASYTARCALFSPSRSSSLLP